MAKKLYVPVNGLSKEVKEFYVSVNGLSKKVVKAYCSVNGLSKQFWGGTPTGEYVFNDDYQVGQAYTLTVTASVSEFVTKVINAFIRINDGISATIFEYFKTNKQTFIDYIIAQAGNHNSIALHIYPTISSGAWFGIVIQVNTASANSYSYTPTSRTTSVGYEYLYSSDKIPNLASGKNYELSCANNTIYYPSSFGTGTRYSRNEVGYDCRLNTEINVYSVTATNVGITYI